jgi:hypothetical protein
MQDHRVNIRPKHFGIHYHYMRERQLGSDFVVQHVSSA